MPNAAKVILLGADGTTAVSATNPLPVTQEASGGASHVIVDSGTVTAVTGITNALPAGENSIGLVGGHTPRITQTYVCPGNASPYAAGVGIMNSATAGSVIPISFNVLRTGATIVSGRLSGVRCVITPASGSLVFPTFDLLLFRPEANIPFAAAGYPADGAALAISPAAMKDLVGVFSFSASAWRSPAGSTAVAGISGYQAVMLASGRQFAPFNLASIAGATTLLALMQCQNAWAPGAVANTFDFALDADLD